MWAWRILGCIAFVFGALGLVMPIWPTTIFWILAALAFAKSNPAWAEWIYARPVIGPAIKEFLETGRMNRASRYASLLGLAVASVFIILLFHSRPYVVASGLALVLIGAIFILTRKRVE